MINPEEWLERYAPGYAQLSVDERRAIAQFTFLWSLFEAKLFNSSASPELIVQKVTELTKSGELNVDPFQKALKYFKKRYFENGQPSQRFDGLRFRDNDRKQLVSQVLSGQGEDAADIISALLLIVHRFRNNLFHGPKWEYEIRGQLNNFRHANSILIMVLGSAAFGAVIS